MPEILGHPGHHDVELSRLDPRLGPAGRARCTDGQCVDILYDGNPESLGGDFGYDAALSRAVGVGAAIIREARGKVYRATRLLEEIDTAATRCSRQTADVTLHFGPHSAIACARDPPWSSVARHGGGPAGF